MLIKYYKHNDLKYSNKKRYRNFNYISFNQEEQKKVLINDGAYTFVKTSKENICDYVTIDDTRWFVTKYNYLNGGQVVMQLQRDVIGEKGIDNFFGKISRGYTDNILKYKKELSVNQILKERKKIIPNTFNYGNYTVNNHENELWGILYFTKPKEINPETGEPYPDSVNINIPAFSPKTVDYTPIEVNKNYVSLYASFSKQSLKTLVIFITEDASQKKMKMFNTTINYIYENNSWNYSINNLYVGEYDNIPNIKYDLEISCILNDGTDDLNIFDNNSYISVLNKYMNDLANNSLYNQNSGIVFPEIPNIEYLENDYDNVIIEEDGSFYKYTLSDSTNETNYGTISSENLSNYIKNINNTIINIPFNFSGISGNKTAISNISVVEDLLYYKTTSSSYIRSYIEKYSKTKLSNEESGTINISTSTQLVDEPYNILVCPLYDVIITNSIETYNIEKNKAFSIFNTVIQSLSGENPYLIDAQIYPYCPVLTEKNTSLKYQDFEYPFFEISSNTYNYNCEIQLLPYTDVKKEYSKRLYSIISPEQTGKFDFYFYDYVNEFEDNNGINYKKINITIKTALKPFSIISSAVIKPTFNSIKGITYDSDLRGSQPTSNGFECSLSSNAFETYRRQNSNYQQIFALQKEELQKTHDVEKSNEIASLVMNTLSATMMGAIGGQAMSDAEFMGISMKGVGAKIGAGIAGATVGTTMGVQLAKNNELREFEKKLLQENFDLQIGTIKNLPNSINRISTFNEIILKDFWYIIEIYECSEDESKIVDLFFEKYSYSLDVYDFLYNYFKNGWFLKANIITSNLELNLHNIAYDELAGGIYYYE